MIEKLNLPKTTLKIIFQCFFPVLSYVQVVELVEIKLCGNETSASALCTFCSTFGEKKNVSSLFCSTINKLNNFVFFVLFCFVLVVSLQLPLLLKRLKLYQLSFLLIQTQRELQQQNCLFFEMFTQWFKIKRLFVLYLKQQHME